MPFIKTRDIIGKKFRTTKVLSTPTGMFTVGSIVTVVAVHREYGYTIEDDDGNQMAHCGWDCIQPLH